MVHVSPEPPPWRRGNIVAGVLLTVVGIAVLVVSVVALRQPAGHSAAAATPTVTHITTITPGASSGSTSSSQSSPAQSSPAQSSSAQSSATQSSGAPSSPAQSSSSATSSASTGNPKSVPLIVLNDTSITRLAATASATFTSGGWTVSSYSNYSNDILSTCAYYDPAVAGAQAAATALQQQFPAIRRVVARFEGLPAGPVVVVLTTDYS